MYFFCSTHLTAAGADLHKVLRERLPDVPLCLVQSIDALRQMLAAPGDTERELLLVFMAGTSQELRLLQALDELLAGHDLVLVVPDQSERVIALAHGLYPRFLCCADDDFEAVAQVITKILATRDKAEG